MNSNDKNTSHFEWLFGHFVLLNLKFVVLKGIFFLATVAF